MIFFFSGFFLYVNNVDLLMKLFFLKLIVNFNLVFIEFIVLFILLLYKGILVLKCSVFLVFKLMGFIFNLYKLF